MKVRNTFIIFLVSGFWHGANWTFIVWGLLNAIYILPSIILNTNRNNIDIVAKGKLIMKPKDFFLIVKTFILTVFAWIFFRAADLSHAFVFIRRIFSKSFFKLPDFDGIVSAMVILILVCFFIILEWVGRENEFALEKIENIFNRPFRWMMYFIIIFMIGMFMQTEETPFIYFQF